MKKNEQKYIAIGIVAIFLIAWFGGYLAQYGLPSPLTLQTTTPSTYTPTDVDKENYAKGIGRWQVYATVVDSLDIATEQTSATNYTIYWYTRQGVNWLYHETGDGSTDTLVTLTPEDSGYLWVVMKIPSGQTKYVDYQKIMEINQYVSQYLYTDVDGDGVKDFAFRYDMKGHAIPNSGYPSITFLGFLLKYDASFTGLNNLANDTAIGQTTNTQFYSYYLSFSASKTGVAIWKVEVKITTTDETKVRLKNLEIPGLGFLDVSSFDKLYTSTDYRYVYTISKNFDGALYLKHAANANNRYEMTLSLEYTLANSDDILITTTVYYLVAQTEAGKTATDLFYAQE